MITLHEGRLLALLFVLGIAVLAVQTAIRFWYVSVAIVLVLAVLSRKEK